MNRGEMGEPILDEEGNVIRYGFTNEGPSLFAPPPPTQLPPSGDYGAMYKKYYLFIKNILCQIMVVVVVISYSLWFYK